MPETSDCPPTLGAYTELEYQRRHLVEQKTPEDRRMVMVGIDRLLDEMLDSAVLEFGDIATSLPNSKEGERHLKSHAED